MKNLSKLDHLTITIECVPKRDRTDKLTRAIWAAVEKHAKDRDPLVMHTEYHYQAKEEA